MRRGPVLGKPTRIRFHPTAWKRAAAGILLAVASGSIVAGCAHFIPNVKGVSATSPSPSTPWKPPAVRKDKPERIESAVSVERLREKSGALTLADAADIALQNNPNTRAAWAAARAAAAGYASSLGAWLPEASLSGTVSRVKSFTIQGNTAVATGPATDDYAGASLSYLLFNFGGRAASVDEARQALLAADWTQNAVIQNTVLSVEVAFFNYAEAGTLLDANKISLADAEANLNAAEERRRVGLATIADALQAKTALSEAKLAVQDAEGQVRTAKGVLATSMGYPANIPFDFEPVFKEVPDLRLSASVDSLIERALVTRPDLQASRALALQASSNARLVRSRLLPSLSATGSYGRTWLEGIPGYVDGYSGILLLQIPIFGGFSRQYDLVAANAAAEAARDRARAAEQSVILDVFSSHSDFLTACERVKTTNDLVESAVQAEDAAAGRYKEGVGSILDLLSAQRTLAAARAEQVNARLGWFTALARLAHDTGILGIHGDNPLAPGAF